MRECTVEELLGPLNEHEKKNAPSLLFVAGDPEILATGARVSIVGARKASQDGLRRTRELVKALVASKAVVVSGLAEGIDTEAHWSAIREGGRTIAVLGTPLTRCFPAENRGLQGLIMEKHLAVSQFPDGRPSQSKNFPMRNRTMALIADATVIIEAGGEKSGTRHQGWEALRLGRLLFMAEGMLAGKRFTWVDEMMEYGAQVLSDDTLDLFLDLLPAGTGDRRSSVTL